MKYTSGCFFFLIVPPHLISVALQHFSLPHEVKPAASPKTGQNQNVGSWAETVMTIEQIDLGLKVSL